MNLQVLFGFVLYCQNEISRCKNNSKFYSSCRKMDGPRTPRDERRRAQHNEGEHNTMKVSTWLITEENTNMN